MKACEICDGLGSFGTSNICPFSSGTQESTAASKGLIKHHICGGKLHEDGKLNRSDIPLIKHIIRLAMEEENQATVEGLISELQKVISSIQGAE